MRGTMDLMKTPQSLRLSLRELFLLVAFVAAILGWYREHRASAPVREGYENLKRLGPAPDGVGLGFGEYRGDKVFVAVVARDIGMIFFNISRPDRLGAAVWF